MVENTLYEETEAGGVGGRRMRAMRETLGDHEFVIAPKYFGKWLVDENKWCRVKQPYQKQICKNRSGDSNFLQGGIVDALRDSSYVLSVMQLVFLVLIPEN